MTRAISINDNKDKRSIKLTNQKRKLTFTTNPPINLINHSTRNSNPDMIINNLRDPIPTHRPNRPG